MKPPLPMPGKCTPQLYQRKLKIIWGSMDIPASAPAIPWYVLPRDDPPTQSPNGGKVTKVS